MNNANAHSARLCQTEIALVPSSPLTDLYNVLTYVDQEKIDEDALRIIEIPQNVKRRSIVPVSKFALTDLSRPEDVDSSNLTETFFKTSTEETTGKKTKTEEMSIQTDLMISPHLLNEDEKAVISISSSCQTFISCTPSISLVNVDPQQSRKYLDNDCAEHTQLYINAAEILTEIVHDVMAIPSIINPVLVNLSQTSCATENTEWNTMISGENNILQSQIQDNSDEGMFDFIADYTCKGDVLYCRSDDNVSVDSTASEKSSIPSLDETIDEDFPVCAEIVDIESNQTYIDEN